MEINNEQDNYITNKSQQYTEKTIVLKESLNLVLHEFKKAFVLSKMYPENEEYQQQFSEISNSLKKILSDFFLLSNDVQVNIDNISKKMLELNIKIEEERKINKDLKRRLGIVENKSNASNELISNYKEIYDMRYLRNWAIILSTLACIGTIAVVYKKPVNTMSV